VISQKNTNISEATGAYRGRPEDTARNAGIAGMLRSGMSGRPFRRRQAATARRSPGFARGQRRLARGFFLGDRATFGRPFCLRPVIYVTAPAKAPCWTF
jgi:hypothetical protein